MGLQGFSSEYFSLQQCFIMLLLQVLIVEKSTELKLDNGYNSCSGFGLICQADWH
jgi:hypothetical protein